MADPSSLERKLTCDALAAVDTEEDKGVDVSEEMPSYDEAETRRILRKVDYRIVPALAVMYLISFIDRSNSMIRSLVPIGASIAYLVSSWQREGCWNESRPGIERQPIQHCTHRLLHPLYPVRNSQQ